MAKKVRNWEFGILRAYNISVLSFRSIYSLGDSEILGTSIWSKIWPCIEFFFNTAFPFPCSWSWIFFPQKHSLTPSLLMELDDLLPEPWRFVNHLLDVVVAGVSAAVTCQEPEGSSHTAWNKKLSMSMSMSMSRKMYQICRELWHCWKQKGKGNYCLRVPRK